MHATQLIFMDAANTIADSIAGVTFSNPDDPNTLIWKPSEQCQLKQHALETLFKALEKMRITNEVIYLQQASSVTSYEIMHVNARAQQLSLKPHTP